MDLQHNHIQDSFLPALSTSISQTNCQLFHAHTFFLHLYNVITNNFRIVHTNNQIHFLKRKYHSSQFGLAGNRSFLWAYLIAISMTLCFLQFILSIAKQTISLISTYQTFQNVIQHFKRILTIVPISMATFIPKCTLALISSLSHFMTGYWPWGVGI